MRIDLIRTVRAAHEMGWIHRDIKPDNIYVDHERRHRIVLNDWNCAARVGVWCSFAGTLWFSDRPHDGEYHAPSTAMDFRALVRTLFCVSKKQLPWVVDNSWEAMQMFWGSIESAYPSFARAIQLASISDYGGLEEILKVLW